MSQCDQLVTEDSFILPAWSLSLEVWLYCLTPLLFKLSDASIRRIVLVSFAAFFLHTMGRTLFHWGYYSGLGYGQNLLLLAFAWIAGMHMARTRKFSWMLAAMFAAHIVLDSAIMFGYWAKRHDVMRFFTDNAVSFCLQAVTLALVILCVRYAVTAGRGKPSKVL